jgi:hypothetical protein
MNPASPVRQRKLATASELAATCPSREYEALILDLLGIRQKQRAPCRGLLANRGHFYSGSASRGGSSSRYSFGASRDKPFI